MMIWAFFFFSLSGELRRCVFEGAIGLNDMPGARKGGETEKKKKKKKQRRSGGCSRTQLGTREMNYSSA